MIKSHSLLHFCFVSSIIILQLVETSYAHLSIASFPGLPLYAPRKRGITLTSQIVVKFISGGGGGGALICTHLSEGANML